MIPDSPQFIFYVDRLLTCTNLSKSYFIDFINKVSPNRCFFFTHNCDISRSGLFRLLKDNNIHCNFDNVMTPNYFLIKYCLNLYNNFSVYPISDSKDYNDFHISNIKIDEDTPDVIFICTNNIKTEDFKIINKSSIPLVLSSNLCTNRLYHCSFCSKDCSIKYLKTFYKNRLIIPDTPPVYNTYYLFKNLSIISKNTIVITDILRDDYMQYERAGCKVILLLTDKTKLDDYIKSPYDTDLVIDNFKNLAYFLKLD